MTASHPSAAEGHHNPMMPYLMEQWLDTDGIWEYPRRCQMEKVLATEKANTVTRASSQRWWLEWKEPRRK